MRRPTLFLGIAVVLAGVLAKAQAQKGSTGVSLTDLSWVEAESVLTADSVVVIPLGVATVEHGPHLKLNDNERLARYLGSRVQAAASVVVAPPLTYYFNPTFLEYPGSTSLTQRTATDMTVQIVRSLARYGPRRFYVLNTGISPLGPLRTAAETVGSEGLMLRYTEMARYIPSAGDGEQTLANGVHAGDIETSIMLYVDPSAVDMTKALKEYGEGFGPMTRVKNGPGVFSASGILGDPTQASRPKGQALVETLVEAVLKEIEALRRSALPVATPRRQVGTQPSVSLGAGVIPQPNGCTPGDERTIRNVGTLFSSFWHQSDAESISLLFTPAGDIRHPDGAIERGRNIIRSNRQELFMHPEYRGSVHQVSLNDIRCLGPNHAIADGKWELRLWDDPSAKAGRGASSDRSYSGWCTLVLTGTQGSWSIEAWRYTIDPPKGTPLPSTLKQPGFIGREHER